jgi:hypothetical protein
MSKLFNRFFTFEGSSSLSDESWGESEAEGSEMLAEVCFESKNLFNPLKIQ